MDHARIVGLIADTVRDYLDPTIADKGMVIDESTPLFGDNGLFDSMGLVSVVVAVEQEVSQATGTAITIADERAMSQRRSPFLSVGSLAAYTEELLKAADVQQGG